VQQPPNLLVLEASDARVDELAGQVQYLWKVTLPIPKNYYEDLDARFGLDPQLLAQLVQLKIL